MKNTILTLTLALLLTACGGGGTSASSSNDELSLNEQTQDDYTPDDIYEPVPDEEPKVEEPTEPLLPEYAYFPAMNGLVERFDYTGAGVVIGIMESEFDLSHVEFADLDILNRDDNSSLMGKDSSHSTSMLSIIATSGIKMNGITQGASFVLGSYNNKEGYSQMNAYSQMNDMGVSVINNSWAGPAITSYDFTKTVKDLATNGNQGKGIVFVFAMGNENTYFKDTLYPLMDDNNQETNESLDEHILIVGALMSRTLAQTLEYPEQRQGFTNYGYPADIFIYDELEVTADLDDTYQEMGGTSSATAIMTSVIAMAQEARPDLDAYTLIELVCRTATQIGDKPYNREDHNGNMRSAEFGCGKLNVDAFLREVEGAE